MKQKQRMRSQTPIHWLPIDSRLVLPLFSFGHVRGVAKIFLTAEMTLAFGVVMGTLLMILFHYLS